MSNLFDTPWSNNQKITLLTNILEGAGWDVPGYLLQTILGNRIQPRWNDIALPPGRSLNACQKIYEDMSRVSRSQTLPPMGLSAFAPQMFEPLIAQGRAAPAQEPPPPMHRNIQPRPPRSTESPMPPTTNGEGFAILRHLGPETSIERPKKRGRPTKEEAEERDRRLAAVGQTYEPKRRPAKKPRPSETPGPLIEPFLGTSPSLQTPIAQRVEAKEESSSGKRRSRRRGEEVSSSQNPPPRSSPEDSGGERSTDAAQSPSDRLLLQRSGERAQAVSAMARSIQQEQSPGFERHSGPQAEGPHSRPPSV
ncbi:hypothetical protein LTR99_000804 [Exophiala xenobiotica]|uniref:Myb-like domain-containing protein n=1 Tax=Vermiconidia calcicola TaxID=1690605 RepID=A0AAV9QN00_9PEZI|nr:hypothetical protein LTR96_000540 [Exophiala xenobiotica]KAK5545367.1 hypothetical protein LTR25_000374 [Vermiconidia calcicola]KAK5548036.1 hypothetical protein LTR23_001745 [Chaetothyriales sp. CCFEE 6169]KAK5307832.1 hypothetical protein LTR99_000804 [Exophiala xenobiotica]KAK5343270.1 hypothetical protein LTR98_000899 [Exophiala xenobiotica]